MHQWKVTGRTPPVFDFNRTRIILDIMYQYGYNIHMKTTINIDDTLLNEAKKILGVHTKTEAVELGLREIIASHKRRELAGLFGSQKDLKVPPRRRSS